MNVPNAHAHTLHTDMPMEAANILESTNPH